MAVLKIRPAASYRCNGIVTGGHDAVTGSQEAPADRMWEDRAR